jgi:hypothetical protein
VSLHEDSFRRATRHNHGIFGLDSLKCSHGVFHFSSARHRELIVDVNQIPPQRRQIDAALLTNRSCSGAFEHLATCLLLLHALGPVAHDDRASLLR